MMKLLTLVALMSTPAHITGMLGFHALSVTPVEVDGNPDTSEWLVFDADRRYRVVLTSPWCVGEPWYPNVPEPILRPRVEYPAVRVGPLHRLVWFDVHAQTLLNVAIPVPTRCTE